MFDNNLMLSPKGIEMCRCSIRMANWYVDNGLANQIDSNTIQLTFEPDGLGHAGDPFYLIERKKICVVCGTNENLSSHHMVPRCYRRYFPDRHERRSRVSLGGDKSQDRGARHWFYDIMAMCKPCHHAYETKAYVLKQELADKVGIPMGGLWIINGEQPENYARIRTVKAMKTLIKHHDKIPEDKQGKLWEHVQECFPDIRNGDIEGLKITRKSISERANITAGKTVVETFLKTDSDFDDFYIMWRKHFVKTMDPKFMPEYWDQDRRLCEEPNLPS